MYINNEKHFQNKRVELSAASLSKKQHSVTVRVDRRRLEGLPFLCQAMWELVKEATFLEDQDLLEKMDRMDLLESYKKGQLKLRAVQCGTCGRKSSSERKTCIYCGHKLDVRSKRIFLDNPAIL